MKTFGYTLRDKEGSLKKGSLQAVDRLDALRQIKERGCIPVAVTEGKGSVPNARVPWNPAAWNRSVWVAVAGVVLIAALSVWLTADKKPAKRPAPATTAKKAGPADRPAPRQGNTPAARPNKAVSSESPAELAVRGSVPAPVPNDTKTVRPVPPQVPAEPKAAEPPQEPARPQPFTTATEQILAMIDSIPPGVTIPPLPDLHGMDDDFARASTNTLVVFDNDHETLVQRMETVAWSKVDLAEMVKQGWKPDEVLTALVKQHNEDADLRSATSLALKKMVDDNSVSLIDLKKELEEINQELAKRNLKGITLDELGLTEE